MKAKNQINQILDFWFGQLTAGKTCREDKRKLWWSKNHEMDHYITNKFAKYIGLAIAGHLEEWLETPEGTLAYIIVLDQFSRHVFRNSKKAYTQDESALKLCLEGMYKGFDKELHPIERIFFYIPLMHSEDIEMQDLSVRKYKELVSEYKSDDDLYTLLSESSDYAQRHFDAVEKFGRFPHRNKILKRESTQEEKEFLQDPRNSF